MRPSCLKMSRAEFDQFGGMCQKIMDECAKSNTPGMSCHRLLERFTALRSVPRTPLSLTHSPLPLSLHPSHSLTSIAAPLSLSLNHLTSFTHLPFSLHLTHSLSTQTSVMHSLSHSLTFTQYSSLSCYPLHLSHLVTLSHPHNYTTLMHSFPHYTLLTHYSQSPHFSHLLNYTSLLSSNFFIHSHQTSPLLMSDHSLYLTASFSLTSILSLSHSILILFKTIPLPLQLSNLPSVLLTLHNHISPSLSLLLISPFSVSIKLYLYQTFCHYLSHVAIQITLLAWEINIYIAKAV